MSDSNTKCSRCGATVSPDALQGICPACLLGMNLSAPTEEPGPEGTQVCRPPLPPGPSIEELKNLFPQLDNIAPLGRGGMGAVYKARQPRLDRFVALKILLRRDSTTDSEKAFAERFCREARALARLAHPDIVAVYDYGEAGGYPYFIMEFVDGLTLRELLKRGKLDPEQALAIVPKICDALQFAHQQGVVHRDIKPENILIDKLGRVKIADFGIAKIVDPAPGQPVLTGGKDVIGTPHYMAPEQVEQPGKVDHRADIFSLGVVFYEMLTGELPLGKFRPPSSKVTVDVRLDEIVLRALEKEPERRYQNISQVKTDVEHVSATSSKGREPEGAVHAAPTAWRRTSAAIAAGGSAVAAVSMAATATQVNPGLPALLSASAAAGLLAVAIHFGRQAAAVFKSPVAGNVASPPALPVSLVLLCVIMIAQGFYAFLETVLRQQPGLVIFPSVFCLVIGVGLLFVQRWARIFALAWVWITYLVLTVMMVKGLFSSLSPDLRIEVMGRAVEDPRQFFAGMIVLVSATLIVPWTHWLLTRDHIKRLFGVDRRSQPSPSQNIGFAIGAVIVVAAVLVWMAMPKQLGTMLSGKVIDAATGEPVQAEITVIGSKSREWRTTTDRNGSYTIQVPPNAGLLYREDKMDHSTEIFIRVEAGGFETMQMEFGETRSLSYYKRAADFQLQPLSASGPAASKASPQPKNLAANPRKAVDPNLLQIRRVLLDTETNATTIWLEVSKPEESRVPVDSIIALNANDIEAATLAEDVFSNAGPLNTRQLSLSIKMTQAATSLFSELTRTNVGRRLAIVVDGKVISAPVVQTQIASGFAVVTGFSSLSELLGLAARLNGLTGDKQHNHTPIGPGLGRELVDLDGRRFSSWPVDAMEWNEHGIDRYFENFGTDLFTELGATNLRALGVWRMRMASLPPDAFANTPSWTDLVSLLGTTNIVAPFGPGAILEIDSEPAVYAFCTAAGSIGVMQIIVETNKVALAYKTLPSGTAPIFGAVKELILNDDGTAKDFFLDFETGKAYTPPRGLDFNSTNAVQWLRANGIDAVGETSTSVQGLVGVEMTAMPVDSRRWDGIRAEDLLRDPVLNNSNAGSHTILSAKGELPETYVFRTREGTRGILQIIGFRDDPRGVKVRYRLVQNTPSARN